MEPKKRKGKRKWTDEQIKALRVTLRLTQADFGGLIKRSRGTIAAWETGAKHPDLASLRALDNCSLAAADAYVEP